MKGLILLKSNYSYEGDIIDNEPHGKGIFSYVNGDRYTGQCKHGKLDGFGVYTFKSGAKYTGFFSYGKQHGVGTFEDEKNIYKGTWRNDRKHGMFYRTQKQLFNTYLQKYIRGRLINYTTVQYIRPELLLTTKRNPLYSRKKYNIRYKGENKQCIGCYDNSTNATNSKCGHVIMCDKCLSKCETCPICRAPIEHVIKLYIC